MLIKSERIPTSYFYYIKLFNHVRVCGIIQHGRASPAGNLSRGKCCSHDRCRNFIPPGPVLRHLATTESEVPATSSLSPSLFRFYLDENVYVLRCCNETFWSHQDPQIEFSLYCDKCPLKLKHVWYLCISPQISLINLAILQVTFVLG